MPVLDHVYGFINAPKLSMVIEGWGWGWGEVQHNTHTRTFLSSPIRCDSELGQVNKSASLLICRRDKGRMSYHNIRGMGPIRRCPLQMAQQHHLVCHQLIKNSTMIFRASHE